MRWLKDWEIEKLQNALETHSNQGSANAIKLILMTGARKNEVLSSKWKDFDLDRQLWTKPSHHTKQKRTEYVPLNGEALRVIRTMRRGTVKDEEFLFPGLREGSHREDVKRFWLEIQDTAKIPHTRIHDLRHTFASHLVSRGRSLPEVGALLGHTDPKTTARYAHLSQDALREATEVFSGVYRGSKKAARKKPI